MRVFTVLLTAMVLMTSFVGAKTKTDTKIEKVEKKVKPKGQHPASIMRIEAVDISKKGTTLILDNGTSWQYNDTDLFKGKNIPGWQVGDRVEIVYTFYKGYFLENMSYHGTIPVKLANGSSKKIQTLKLKEIEKNVKKSTHTLILEDKSKWFIGSWSSSWMVEWEEGDRILITPQKFVFGHADYLLINLDRSSGKEEAANVRAQLLYVPELSNEIDLNRRAPKAWKVCLEKMWQSDSALMIALDNQTLWKCEALGKKKPWQIGDEIIVEDLTEGKLALVNVRTREGLKASLDKTELDKLVTLTIQSIAKKGKKMILSDGTIWTPEVFSNFSAWKEGNRIILTTLGHTQFDTTTHFMINLDQKGEKNGFATASATLVQ